MRPPIEFEHFENALTVPGRILVFLDESELSVFPESPIDLYGGVIMRSEQYPDAAATLNAVLGDYPLARELHAVEVVNPSKKSEGWTDYGEEERRQVIARWGACLSKSALSVPYLQLRRDQWKEMLVNTRTAPDTIRGRLRKPGEAVGAVALWMLVPFIRREYGSDTVVIAQDSKVAQQSATIWRFEDDTVYEDAVFSVSSHLVPGLQLADLAIYTVSRGARLVVQTRGQAEPKLRPIDREILSVLATLNVRPLAQDLAAG